MKNQILIPILLPVNPENRTTLLYTTTQGKLYRGEVTRSYNSNYTNQHLYLCSPTEIKEGDWVLNSTHPIEGILEVGKDVTLEYAKIRNRYFKILFTTDPELWDIKQIDGWNYGVIAIDGNTKAFVEGSNNKTIVFGGSMKSSKKLIEVNFLEWFCKGWNGNMKDAIVRKYHYMSEISALDNNQKEIPDMKPLGEGFVKKVLARYTKEEISFGKMVELFNEQIQSNPIPVISVYRI